MAMVLVAGGGFGYAVHRANVQRGAIAAIHATGGQIYYDWQLAASSHRPPSKHPRIPGWLFRGLGPDYFGTVGWVRLGDDATDATMAQVERLPRLKTLYLGGSRVTAVGLASLARVTELEEFYLLSSSSLTSADLVHFRGLVRLKELDLGRIVVHDADLAAITHLANLESLNLTGSGITDAGMIYLADLTQLRSLNLGDVVALTGAGLKSLAALTELTNLDLRETRVGDDGLTALGSGLNIERLMLARTPVTDTAVDVIQGWDRLLYVDLTGTSVTRERLDQLRAARPNLAVDPW